ncbi:MAG: HlyD family efflux transporter periplasmic adaptor subunit [Roseivirga sp.]|nr:HlyD family efflux transporter periplasmic adaptor subunit [Roseivirga sp.]
MTTVTESVYASLTIRPDSAYFAYASVSGLIESISVEEGDPIDKTAELMQIVNTSPELSRQNAALTLEQAQQNLNGASNFINELEEEISIAILKLENDSINFVKQQNLWKKNIGTQNDYDAKKLVYETSSANVKLLKNRLKRTQSDLDNQLQQAQNNYQNAITNARDYTVNSRINGKVYELLKEPGEIVTLQEPLAMIGSASDFNIEMLIDEVDIARVQTGQTVLIALDAYPGKSFKAGVTRIHPIKDESTQTFMVEAVFENPPERLFAGLSGEANIVISAKENALVIPRKYLTDQQQVRTNEGLVSVTTGLVNLDKVEILSGIEASTNLYLPEQ